MQHDVQDDPPEDHHIICDGCHEVRARAVLARECTSQVIPLTDHFWNEVSMCDMPLVAYHIQLGPCVSSRGVKLLLTVAYKCASCEERSYLLHDPMHSFFKLPRPVHRPIQSASGFLPKLCVPLFPCERCKS